MREKGAHETRLSKEKKKGSMLENKEDSSKSMNVVAEEDSESGDSDMLSISSSSDHLTDS